MLSGKHMKRTLLHIFTLSLFLPALSVAQDARFSQYYNNPLLSSPAMAGNGIEYIRVTATYRSQWAGLGKPFSTQGLFVDKVVSRVGIGGYIVRHGAGDAGIKTIQAGGNFSYNLPVGYEKNNTITGGIQLGLLNKSFDQSSLTFDNQYTPDVGYDPNIASGEYFANTSITRPDISIGFMWQRGWTNKDIRFKPYAGISFAHVNKPKEIFIEEAAVHPVKTTYHLGAAYQLNEKTEIRPSLQAMNQGPFTETTFGTMLSYTLPNENHVQLGVYDRVNDAVIAYAGYQVNQLMLGFSYDVNTSALSTSGKGVDAFELSLTWSPKPKRKKTPKEIEDIKESIKPREKVDISIEESIEVTSIELPEDSQPELALEPSARIIIPEKVAPEKEPIEEAIMLDTTPLNIAPIEIETIAEFIPDEIPERESISIMDKTVTDQLAVNSGMEIASDPDVVVNTEYIPAKPIAVEDTDQDGVNDEQDECPFIFGSPATHGCPDSDNDGIIDQNDDCPMDAGTLALNGCPEKELSKEAATGQTTIKSFNNILFDTGRDKLRTDDIFEIIERAIDLMYANPDAQVILSGHTDSEGDPRSNMYLSQARANIVKKYMMKQGVEEDRISIVTYGESMPLVNNKTEEGRQQNRRVEINIIRK